MQKAEESEEQQLNVKSFFHPLTTFKVIHWLILLGIIVYANMLFNKFVWDDITYIWFNPDVHTIDLGLLFSENSFNFASGQYRALTALYFAFVYSLFGTNTFFYHVLQLFMHLANVILVYFLFKKYFSVAISFFLSVIFLVHPIQVESVSFIGASGNLLFFLFGILSLHLVLKQSLFEKKYVQLLIAILLLLSLLAKETGLGFSVLGIVFVYAFNRKKIWNIILISVLALACYFAIRFGIGHIYFNNEHLKNVIPINNLSFEQRLLTIPAVLFYYLWTFVYPAKLAINQLWVVIEPSFQNFYLPLGIILSLFMIAVWFGRSLRKGNNFIMYWLFLLWFSVGMGIHSQIIPLDMTVADRWFYFPMVGLLGMIGFMLTSVSSRYKDARMYWIIGCILILMLSVRTIVRNTNWQDNIPLFAHDVQVMDNYDLETNLATFYNMQGRPDVGIVHAKKSVDLYAYDGNLTTLGFIAEAVGDTKLAEESYRRAIFTTNKSARYESKAAYSYLRWGGIYLFDDKPTKAVEIYAKGVAKYPNDGVLRSFYAVSLYESGRYETALESARKAKELTPSRSTEKLYELILQRKQIDLNEL